MALPLFKERRFSRREQLTGLMPGRLFLKDSKTDVFAKPVDVSENGIGIVVNIQMPIGTTLILQRDDAEYELEVSWSQPDFGKNDLTRYGLVCKRLNVNLLEVFREAGCIKE
jgi:hypothetical protein